MLPRLAHARSYSFHLVLLTLTLEAAIHLVTNLTTLGLSLWRGHVLMLQSRVTGKLLAKNQHHLLTKLVVRL